MNKSHRTESSHAELLESAEFHGAVAPQRVSVADGEPYTVERFTGEWESLAAAISDFVVAACDVPFVKWDITTISPRSRRQGTPEVRSGIWSSSERVF